MSRTPALLVALLGILKAGAAYLPLDADLPGERLAFMIDDAGATILVADRETAAAPSIAGRAPLLLDDDLPASESARGAAAPADVGADDLAYVIYTSGSTGTPKGVEVTHGAVVNALSSFAREPGCTDRDRVLALTTVSFDIAAMELFVPLSVGARIELASRDTARDPRLLRRLIDRTRPTIVQTTPTTWRMLIDADWRGAPALVALCGGERLPRDLADLLLARVSAVWNLYGPTEATIWCTLEKVEPDRGEVPIGRPIRNTEAYILDARREPVPIGVPGELYIAGDGVARGYRNRPALTAERFLPHAFSAMPGRRMYRTGDLAHWTDDGRIAFRGRIDAQVKLRGFRIELGEIEATLNRHPTVAASVAVVRDAESADAHIAAYVVPSAATIDRMALRDWLVRWLPTYMIPSRFVVMQRLPVLASGKVDYRSLPPPIEEPAAAPEPPPDDSIIAAIIDAWRETLKIQAISPEDDFFRLGGHSLLAATAVRRLSATLGIEVPLRFLFDTPSAAKLAHRIEGLKSPPPNRPQAPIVRKAKPKPRRK
jgi:amino acid adenylation domain-containing protein